MEARLLAGHGYAEAAGPLGLPPGVVEAYERVFYAVADRLEALDYVALVAFGPRAYTGYARADEDLLARIIAFNHGPLALDALLAHLGWPGATRGPVDAPTARALEFLIDVLTMPHGQATDLALLKMALRFYEDEAHATDRGNGVFARALASPSIESLADPLPPQAADLAPPALEGENPPGSPRRRHHGPRGGRGVVGLGPAGDLREGRRAPGPTISLPPTPGPASLGAERGVGGRPDL